MSQNPQKTPLWCAKLVISHSLAFLVVFKMNVWRESTLQCSIATFTQPVVWGFFTAGNGLLGKVLTLQERKVGERIELNWSETEGGQTKKDKQKVHRRLCTEERQKPKPGKGHLAELLSKHTWCPPLDSGPHRASDNNRRCLRNDNDNGKTSTEPLVAPVLVDTENGLTVNLN